MMRKPSRDLILQVLLNSWCRTRLDGPTPKGDNKTPNGVVLRFKTRLTATLKESSRDEKETESYGPDREWSTSTNASELNQRTYTRDGIDIRLGPRRYINRGEASNTCKTLKSHN